MIARHYETATAFRTALEDRLLRLAADDGTDVQRHRRQVAFDRFLCRLSHHSHGNWALKGGYTRPRTDRENSRVKDLVDMVLLIDSGELSAPVLACAIRDTFDNRHTHPIPPTLAPPPLFWNEPFAALAKECGIDPIIAAQFTKCARYLDTLAPALSERRIPFSKVDCSGNELAMCETIRRLLK